MKRMYSVFATIAIVAFISYGMITEAGKLGLIFLVLLLCVASLFTIPYTEQEIQHFPMKHAVWMGILGIFLTFACAGGVLHLDGPYWLTFAVMIAILSVRPNLVTVYFAAALLGVTATILYLNWQKNCIVFYSLFHFGCVIVFALSTWIRVYIDYKKSLTPKE